MNPQFLHIATSGVKKPIEFSPHLDNQLSEALRQNFRQSFISSGKFGTIFYEQIDLPMGRLQNIRLNLKEEVEINYCSDFENISLLYCNTGFIKLQISDFPKVLLVQTQTKIIHSLNSEKYSVLVKQTGTKAYNLVNISIPVTQASSEKTISINEIKNYFQQFSNVLVDQLAFTSTISFQKAQLAIQEELNNESPDWFIIQAYVDILLLEILSQIELLRPGQTGFYFWDPEIKAVYSMAEMIILGMDESWTIKKFASAQQLNPNKLKLLFKKHMGMPAAAFRISVRMQKASQLLRETTLSIQEISALVGYTNPAQFSSMFKKKIGSTPHQVRKG